MSFFDHQPIWTQTTSVHSHSLDLIDSLWLCSHFLICAPLSCRAYTWFIWAVSVRATMFEVLYNPHLSLCEIDELITQRAGKCVACTVDEDEIPKPVNNGSFSVWQCRISAVFLASSLAFTLFLTSFSLQCKHQRTSNLFCTPPCFSNMIRVVDFLILKSENKNK